jgi:phage portal protein BeeE
LNILSYFFKLRDKPHNLLGGYFTFLFGPTSSGKAVNEKTAMQTAAVYTCVRILSESIAGLPLHVYKYKDGGGSGAPRSIRCSKYSTAPPALR